MLREHIRHIGEVISQFCTDQFPVRAFKPHIAFASLLIDVHIEVTYAKAFRLQIAHKGIRTLEAVCLEYGEIAVFGLALSP